MALRFFGFVQQAIQVEQMLKAKIKANAVANIPVTNKEWQDAAEKGDL